MAVPLQLLRDDAGLQLPGLSNSHTHLLLTKLPLRFLPPQQSRWLLPVLFAHWVLVLLTSIIGLRWAGAWLEAGGWGRVAGGGWLGAGGWGQHWLGGTRSGRPRSATAAARCPNQLFGHAQRL